MEPVKTVCVCVFVFWALFEVPKKYRVKRSTAADCSHQVALKHRLAEITA